MTTQSITNSLAKQLQPKSKHYDVRDTNLKNFLIRVNKSGTKSYIVQYGRGKRVTLGNTEVLTATQARDLAKQVLGDVARGIDPKKQKEESRVITLGQFIKNDYETYALSHFEELGKENIQVLDKHFSHLYSKNIKEICEADILKWRSTVLQSKTLKENTINRTVFRLRSVFNLAIKYKYLSTHPLEELSPLEYDDERVRYLDKDEKQRLFDALSMRDQEKRQERIRTNEHRKKRCLALYPDKKYFGDHLLPMVIISLNTGLRRSELLKVKKHHIDFSNRHIHIPKTKTKKKRNIPLNKVALTTLTKWLEQTNCLESPYVFPSPKNPATHISDPKKAWLSVLEKAKITDFHWHDMRHHFASTLVMAGVSIYVVSKLLGHASVEQTERYAHLAPDLLEDSVGKINETPEESTNTLNKMFTSDYKATISLTGFSFDISSNDNPLKNISYAIGD